MNHKFGEKLPANVYMLWELDDPKRMKKKGYKKAGDPIEYFKKKYGYMPTQCGKGEGVDYDSQGLNEDTSVLVPVGYVVLR